MPGGEQCVDSIQNLQKLKMKTFVIIFWKKKTTFPPLVIHTSSAGAEKISSNNLFSVDLIK